MNDLILDKLCSIYCAEHQDVGCFMTVVSA